MAKLLESKLSPRVPQAFRRVAIDEPLEIHIGVYRNQESCVRLCHALAEGAPRRQTLLIAFSGNVADIEPAGLLEAAAVAQRLVVTAVDRTGLNTMLLVKRHGLAQGLPRRGGALLVEPDFHRAVLATMQLLRAEDRLTLLVPESARAQDALRLVRQGARWRAAFDQPEFGEFHSLPDAPAARSNPARRIKGRNSHES